jgi:hypothetical protein
VAAVSVSCSGDKSDKEESAGYFGLWGLWLTAALFDALNNGFDGLDKHVAVGFHSLTLPSGPSCRPHLPDLGPPVGSWLQ